MGLLVMAYGTPYKEEDIESYYTHIRGGRRPSDEQIEDLKSRYVAIGGISPLAEITNQQAKKLQETLNNSQDKVEFQLYIGLKHIEPFIEDAVIKMHEDGITEAVSIVLAPHYSTFSVKSYHERAKKAAESSNGPEIYQVDSWYQEPKFIQFWAKAVKGILAEIDEKEKAVLIISAHSLPEKILSYGDPYPNQLQESADMIAQAAGVAHYELGWQSAGQTGEPWLGPDVQDLTRSLHEKNQFTHYIYAPIGFVADHLEVLYDNDYECRVVTEEIGAIYHRPPMPNVDLLFIEALASVVLKRMDEVQIVPS